MHGESLMLASLLIAASAIPASGQGLFASNNGGVESVVEGNGLGISRRQVDIFCTTCSDCLGEGYILCGQASCFNPDKHQQCCASGGYCVAEDNSCCDALDSGPGVTGTDGVPIPIPTTSHTGSFAPSDTPTSFECYRNDTGEECCARGINLRYCSGKFPAFGCYVAGKQTCCDNGEVCYGEDCCENLWSAAPVDDGASMVTEAPTSSGDAQTSGATTTEDASTSTSTGAAAAGDVLGGMAPIAAGVLGLVAWL